MLTSGKNLDGQFNRIGRGRFALGHQSHWMCFLLYAGAAAGCDPLILFLILEDQKIAAFGSSCTGLR